MAEFTDQNPPAFPRSYNAADGHNGMTLRDWFAGQNAAAVIGGIAARGTNTDASHAELIARSAYLLADAMLAARAKEPSA